MLLPTKMDLFSPLSLSIAWPLFFLLLFSKTALLVLFLLPVLLFFFKVCIYFFLFKHAKIETFWGFWDNLCVLASGLCWILLKLWFLYPVWFVLCFWRGNFRFSLWIMFMGFDFFLFNYCLGNFFGMICLFLLLDLSGLCLL